MALQTIATVAAVVMAAWFAASIIGALTLGKVIDTADTIELGE